MKKLAIFVLVGAIVIVMLITGALVVLNPGSTSNAAKLDYGQEIEVDDFAFAALGSERTPQIGTLTARGTFYVVQFQVTNHAKRIGFTFRPDTAILVDSFGTEHSISPAARDAWFGANGKKDACARELAPGEVCVTTLVYEVPANTQAPLLKMAFGGRVFEIADALMYGNRVIQLK